MFFLGKHFGTGVILATAFVHLLQDAFKALLDPEVLKLWPGGREWGGLIVYARSPTKLGRDLTVTMGLVLADYSHCC